MIKMQACEDEEKVAVTATYNARPVESIVTRREVLVWMKVNLNSEGGNLN